MQFTDSQLDDFGTRQLDVVDTVIIHHSVYAKTADITEIDVMERRSQGFVAVGYHAYAKCVSVNGDSWVVQNGRPIWAVPAAAYGMNTDSYDICIGGNYQPGVAGIELDDVSEHALTVVAARIAEAKAKLPNLKYLIGHRDVATIKAKAGLNPGDYSTACPGDRLYERLHDLRVMTGLANRPELA